LLDSKLYSAEFCVESKNAFPLLPFERNPRFVGRVSEISKISDILTTDNRCERVAIIGLGGVGKTQVALKFAYDWQDQYPECPVFWVPANRIDSMQEAYFNIGRHLRIPNLEKEKDKIQQLVHQHLSKESTGRWLLIFDSADEIDIWFHKSGNLVKQLPKSKLGSIIFTTRSRKIAVKLAINNVIQIDRMNQDTAKQLLKNYLIDPQVLNDGLSTANLLEWLSYLPLAVIQAAAYINENGISISDYLALLERKDKEQDVIDILSKDFEDEGSYDGENKTVATTWLISFEQIQRRDSLADEYLRFMSCIDAKDIPQSLLPPAESMNKATEAVGTLSAYSFVTRTKIDGFLDIHRLVHLATRNWLRLEKALEKWKIKALQRLNEVFPDHEHKNRVLWRTLLSHAHYVLESHVDEDVSSERMLLLWKYVMCLYSDGRYNEAEKGFVEVMETRKRILGAEHPDTLASMANLASTYQNQGRWKEAEELEVQVMETRKRVLGAEHPDTLTSMNNLAFTRKEQGRVAEAIELMEECVQLQTVVLGADHPNTLSSSTALIVWKTE